MQLDVLHSICRLVVIKEAEQVVQYIEIETISHEHGTMSMLSQNCLQSTDGLFPLRHVHVITDVVRTLDIALPTTTQTRDRLLLISLSFMNNHYKR